MDASGRFAAHTGADCVDWCGHLIRDTFSVAGNMLAGPAGDRRDGARLRGQRRPALRRAG